ncbi:MAG: YggS family pyridoxal phosphate-dependent enzyme [Oscillospiraceae bacterium]|nr:YggS family pyridoxal phosphate-dependent enzyme [Oscillospiraceae bacterium]
MSEDFKTIAENYKRITEDVEKTANGRKVRIMAVTKTVPTEKVNYALSLGIELLGENRAQEFLQKHAFYEKNTKKVEIHFIGGLQNNKVRVIIDKIDMIQSADSVKLLTEIEKQAKARNLNMNVLIEVNIGSEFSKNGIKPDGLSALLVQADEFEHITLRGLMAIPPVNAEEKVYANMQKLYEESKSKVRRPEKFDTLSMGMSGDYRTAIKHGANIIRIGSALFGNR